MHRLKPMQAAAQIPFNELPRGDGESGAVRDISAILNDSGLDASTRLYNEALQLAQEGHLGRSRDRLRMLLCLNPEDGQGHMLLAKIFASQKRWQEAIAELDAAAACGQKLPAGMKASFEQSRNAILQDNRAEQIADRIGAEVRALRDETRRLRVEKSRLERTNREMERRVQVWTIGTIFSTTLALAAVGMLMFGGGSEETQVTETVLAADPIYAEHGVETNTLHEVVADPIVEAPAPAVIAEPAPVEVAPVVVEPPPAETVTPEAIQNVEIISTTEVTNTGVRTYTVVSGDNLSGIARKMYGKSSLWREILAANQELLGGNVALSIGMELTIPAIE